MGYQVGVADLAPVSTIVCWSSPISIHPLFVILPWTEMEEKRHVRLGPFHQVATQTHTIRVGRETRPGFPEGGSRTRSDLADQILEATVHQIYGEKNGGVDDNSPIIAVTVWTLWVDTHRDRDHRGERCRRKKSNRDPHRLPGSNGIHARCPPKTAPRAAHPSSRAGCGDLYSQTSPVSPQISPG